MDSCICSQGIRFLATAFEAACELIREELKDGDWHSSKGIHKKFNGKIAEGIYGRVKSALAIEHRRVKGDSGPAEYFWRLPQATSK